MSLPADRLPADAGQVLRRIRRHLDRAEGFSLLFLFAADDRAAADLRTQLDWLLRYHARRLKTVDALGADPDDATLSGWLGSSGRDGALGGVWLDLLRRPAGQHGPDEDLDPARVAWLALLNEQRSRLERGLHCALFVVLPSRWQGLVWQVAPDLWTVRSLVGDVPVAVAAAPEKVGAETSSGSTYTAPLSKDRREAAIARVNAWRQLMAGGLHQPETIAPFVGGEAIQAAWALGDIDLTQTVVAEVLDLCRRRLAILGETPEALRDLSVSLDNVGDVARARGRLDEAESAYRESLELSRRLLKAVGETPEALRDLSVSLNKVGDVARACGRLDEAEELGAEKPILARSVESDRTDEGDPPNEE